MLNRYLFLSLLLLCVIGCNNSGDKKVISSEPTNVIELRSADTSIYVTAETRSIGTLYEGEKVEGVLHIRNSSDTLSIIKEIKASCGCMTIKDVFPKSIKDKEVVSLQYTIDTSLKSGEEFFDILIISSTGKYVIELVANVRGKS